VAGERRPAAGPGDRDLRDRDSYRKLYSRTGRSSFNAIDSTMRRILMTRSPIRLIAVLAVLLLGLTFPALPEETCEQTDLFIANVVISQTQLLLYVSNPTDEELEGYITIEAEYDDTPVDFGVPIVADPVSTTIVDIEFPTQFSLGDIGVCGGDPSGITEAPDPIVVRKR
jgi:hypothetical protein